MKLRSALLLTLPLVVAVAAFTSRPPAQARQPVNVHVTCGDAANATVVSVAPWKKPGARGQVVTWQWQGVTAMQVQPNTNWPLTRVANSPKGTIQFRVNANAPKDSTYHYRLTLTCPHKTIVIDPDVIVQ